MPQSFYKATVRIVYRYLLTLFGIATPGYAQLFFTPGYAVSASGDTLKGDLRAPDVYRVDFRAPGTDSTRTYTPAQLRRYQADGQVYQSVQFRESGVDRAYFMLERVSGPVSLYQLFRPDGRLTHAIRLPDDTFVPLRGNLTLLTLRSTLTACATPAFTRLLDAQLFEGTNFGLTRIIDQYNRCVAPAHTTRQTTTKKPFRYELGLSAGLARNHWSYGRAGHRNTTYYDPSGAYSPDYTVALGGFFTLAPRKRLSATIELMGSAYQGSRLVPLTDPLDPSRIAPRTYSFRETYLTLPITGRYVFIDKAVRWYVRAGLGPSLTTIHRALFTFDGYSDPIDLPILHRTNIGVGYLLGVGANLLIGQKQPLYLEIRAMPHSVLDGVSNIATSHSLQLNLSVPLLKRY